MYNYVVNNMYKSEETVSENKHHGDNNGKPVIVDGNSKIMISTPHCVKHIRDGKLKSSDIFTYSLGDFLNKSLDCPFIYQSGLDGTDANHSEPRESKYKRELLKYVIKNDIKLLIDLHGMKDGQGSLVDIGTGGLERETLCNKTTEFEIIKYHLGKELGADTISDNKIFDCKSPNTISNYISANCEIPCIQLEIASILRQPNNSEELVRALTNAIAQINYFYKSKSGDTKQWTSKERQNIIKKYQQ